MYRAANGILEIVVSAVVVGKLLLFLQKTIANIKLGDYRWTVRTEKNSGMKELIHKLEQLSELSENRKEFYVKLIPFFQGNADKQVYKDIYSNLCGLLAHGDLSNEEYDLLKEVLNRLERL